MRTTASLAKHPIHPMLIPLPIGLWIFSLVCEITSLVKSDTIWGAVALYTMAGGVVGALLAALPGFVDLVTLPPSSARRKGFWHLGVNLTIVTLYVLNVLWRRHADPATMGPLALSVAAVLLLAISGWLGGEMVYVHGVGVEPVNAEKLG